ncbi:hypothetical protein [Cereibacter changlensis]|uniref:hypothetical protein n=1 Tax=Cereibacter changlensis TaxID=402884 RepID=UPI001FEB7E05|nr:hypothetical protein [Cereibacter changlensis]
MLSGELLDTKAHRQDPRQITMQRQIESLALARRRHWRRHDLVDQPADRIARLALLVGVAQAGDDGANAFVVGLRHLRMNAHG